VPVPVRTCIGCGAATARVGLVRLRIEGERVVIDRSGRGGRGAWLHASDACLEKAARKRAFARAFRGVSAAIDLAELRVGLTGSARKD
jgi:predicted RNA-binding protein YlxR (DUF448 family)